MKERGILFSGAMVRALLDGTKTQTRRAVKNTALAWLESELEPGFVADRDNGLGPYGQPGDRLWVRETFFAFGRWETRHNEKKQRDEWYFIDMTAECDCTYQYAADNPDLPLAKGRGVTPGWHTRPALFMPRAVSRILLEIVAVRVERLQEIGEADARAEGVSVEERHTSGYCAGEFLPPSIRAYRELWEQINGAGSWDANPWVWVVEFKRIGS